MPFRTIPQLLVALVAVAALAFAAGAYGASPVAVGAAAAFAAVVIAGTGLALLKGGGGVVHVSRACAELMALTWCWGGVSLLLAYGPAGLKWQHGWQYACAMLLIAVALAWHARRIVPGSNAATLFALEWGRKAAFAQGLGAGLGVREPVVSPTFTLARVYDGRLRMVHVDVYRLETVHELLDLGLDDLAAGESVTVVEWGDVVSGEFVADRLEVALEHVVDDPDARHVTVRACGPRWAARSGRLRSAVTGAA